MSDRTVNDCIETHKSEVRKDLLRIRHAVPDIRGFVKVDTRIDLDRYQIESIADHCLVRTKYISSRLGQEWVDEEVFCPFDGIQFVTRVLTEMRGSLRGMVNKELQNRGE